MRSPVGCTFVNAGPLIIPFVRNALGDQQRVERLDAPIRAGTAPAHLVVVQGNIHPDRQFLRRVRILHEPDRIIVIEPVPIVTDHENRVVRAAKRWAVRADDGEHLGMQQRKRQRTLTAERKTADRATRPRSNRAIICIDETDHVLPNIIAVAFAVDLRRMVKK